MVKAENFKKAYDRHRLLKEKLNHLAGRANNAANGQMFFASEAYCILNSQVNEAWQEVLNLTR